MRLVRLACGEAPSADAPASRFVVDGRCAAAAAVDAGTCVESAASFPLRVRAALGWASGARLVCLPSFLIVGAQKSATGSLADWLGRHPQLRRGVGANGHPNEVHHFDTLEDGAAPEDTWRAYLDAFPAITSADAASGVATFEKSPSYARFPYALAAAAALVPSAHLVVVLRDPVDRAYSAFGHHARRRRFATTPSETGARSLLKPTETCARPYAVLDDAEAGYGARCATRVRILSDADPDAFDGYVRGATVAKFFDGGRASDADDERSPPPVLDVPGRPGTWAATPEGAIDVVADGDYAAQLERCYENYPPRRIHVLFFDDVVADPLGVLDELQTVLGLPYHDFEPQIRRRKGRFDVVSGKRSFYESLRATFASPPSRRSTPPMADGTRRLLRAFYARPLERLWRTLRDHGDLRVIPPASWGRSADAGDDAAPRFRRRRSPRVARPEATDPV